MGGRGEGGGSGKLGEVPQKRRAAGQTSQWTPISGIMLNDSPTLQGIQPVMPLLFYSYGFLFYIKIFNPSTIDFDVNIKYTSNVLCLPKWYLNAPVYNHAITYGNKTCGNYTYFLPYLCFIFICVLIYFYILIPFSSLCFSFQINLSNY